MCWSAHTGTALLGSVLTLVQMKNHLCKELINNASEYNHTLKSIKYGLHWNGTTFQRWQHLMNVSTDEHDERWQHLTNMSRPFAFGYPHPLQINPCQMQCCYILTFSEVQGDGVVFRIKITEYVVASCLHDTQQLEAKAGPPQWEIVTSIVRL